MKKIISISLLLIVLMSCGPSKKKIIAFNDAIIAEQIAVIKSEDLFIKTLNNRILTQVDANYQNLLNQIDKSQKKVSEITDPDPEIGFKQAAIKLFDVYKTQTVNGYKQLVELSKIPDSLYTPANVKQFEETSSSVYTILNAEVNSFISVQKKLAEKHKFMLQKY
jgi:hypothetical protein